MNTERDRDDFERWHRYGRDRGWFARMGDEVRSWFGDEEAERRRRNDEMRRNEEHSFGERQDLRRTTGGGMPYGSGFGRENTRPGLGASMFGSSGMERRNEYGSRIGPYGGGERGTYSEHERMERNDWERPQFNPYTSREDQQHGRVHMSGGRMQSTEMERYHGMEHPYSGSFGGRTGETFFGKGPRNYRRTDEQIKDEICHKLTFDPDIDATDIDLVVENGEVTLTGMVHTRREKRQAEEMTEDIFGVNNVHNNLRVGVNQMERSTDQLTAQQRQDQILERPR